jgi:hypothetical protein
MTDSTTLKATPKAKLPRKRKKAAIKAQGRKWYHNTIKFFYICQKNPFLVEREPICRFWVNVKRENPWDHLFIVPQYW